MQQLFAAPPPPTHGLHAPSAPLTRARRPEEEPRGRVVARDDDDERGVGLGAQQKVAHRSWRTSRTRSASASAVASKVKAQ